MGYLRRTRGKMRDEEREKGALGTLWEQRGKSVTPDVAAQVDYAFDKSRAEYLVMRKAPDAPAPTVNYRPRRLPVKPKGPEGEG